jgi:hypothetical protein
MATATVEPLKPQPQPQLITKQQQVIPLKIAIFGETGAGKTTTGALIAAWLSKQHHNGAPVYVTDPELGWQFPKRKIFAPEKIELVQRTVPTFKAMLLDMREAERNGCVYAVELSKIWIELLKTVRAKCGQNWGNQLNAMWTDYVAHFLNSKLHCIALGRVGDVTEEVRDENDQISKVKIRDKMKAGGSNDFGYEPHLVLRMTLEKKARRVGNEKLEGEGRNVHRADVLKDRTWELNGKVFRWSDKAEYKPGGFLQVAQSIRPHFVAVQETMGIVLDTTQDSSELVDLDGNSEFYRMRERRDVLVAELSATFDLLWGGQGKEEKRLRKLVGEAIFGVLTQDAWEKMSLEKIERGVHIAQAFRKRCQADGLPDTELATLNALQIDINAFDEGTAEENDLPF